ncbi:hypothetical protein D3C75_1205920 [compost metagenome]
MASFQLRLPILRVGTINKGITRMPSRASFQFIMNKVTAVEARINRLLAKLTTVLLNTPWTPEISLVIRVITSPCWTPE